MCVCVCVCAVVNYPVESQESMGLDRSYSGINLKLALLNASLCERKLLYLKRYDFFFFVLPLSQASRFIDKDSNWA